MAALLIALIPAACTTQSVAFRHKLTLDVEVDGQTLRAFNVMETGASEDSFTKNANSGIRGEAIVMELRPGRLLVALLTAMDVPDPARPNFSKRRNRWPDMGAFYGVSWPSSIDWYAYQKRIAVQRGERDIPLEDLPDLVTFSDPNDPRSVKLVDPRNMEASFGPGVRIVRAKVEVVDPKTPLTRGIEKKLPWLVELKGKTLFNFGTNKSGSAGNSIPERLHGGNFKAGS